MKRFQQKDVGRYDRLVERARILMSVQKKIRRTDEERQRIEAGDGPKSGMKSAEARWERLMIRQYELWEMQRRELWALQEYLEDEPDAGGASLSDGIRGQVR